MGSLEFYLGYAARGRALCLLDNEHYYPDDQVADKISSLLIYCDRLALHLTRHMHWDSDHVVRLNDEMRSIAHELVACDVLDRTSLGLDFFDASFNFCFGMAAKRSPAIGSMAVDRFTSRKNGFASQKRGSRREHAGNSPVS